MFYRPDHGVGRTFGHLGKTYLFFGGTAYLGMNALPEALRLHREGLRKYGTNVGSSRNNNVQLDIYGHAEEYLANWLGFEASIVVSSGFLATQLAVRSLMQDAEIYYAPGSHPALWTTPISPAPQQSFDEWVTATTAHINRSNSAKFVVASDTFASIKPICYDFSAFCEINDGKDVYFLLDDSHGFGVFQNPSITYLRQLHRPHFHFVLTGSLAKGLGIDAGVILGEAAVMNGLRENPIYAGASPPSPAAMHALIHGRSLYEKQRERLQKRMEWFEAIIQTPHQSFAGFPVYCFDDANLSHYLATRNIVISSFSYPLPTDPLLNRVVINSLHTKADIRTVAKAIHAGA